MKKLLLLPAIAAFVLIGFAAPMRATPDPRETVIRLFDRYDLVAIPERHRSKEVHEFLRALVRDSRLTKHGVTNIVVEFGNAKYQAVADRYVFGGALQPAELQKIWRDTTQFLVWDSPVYEEFFRTVREVNLRRPESRKIRVVLGDPPIAWEVVHTKEDYKQYADRDLFFADVVEQEVLNKKQKALLIAGGVHFINAREPKKEVPDAKRSAADLLHRRHPGKLFAFWHTSLQIEPTCGSPCAFIVKGSRFEKKSFAEFAPKGLLVQKVIDGETKWVPLESSDWPSTAEMADGLIYYGPTDTKVEAPASVYKDMSYVKELRRRATILAEVYGMDFGQQLDAVLSPVGSR